MVEWFSTLSPLKPRNRSLWKQKKNVSLMDRIFLEILWNLDSRTFSWYFTVITSIIRPCIWTLTAKMAFQILTIEWQIGFVIMSHFSSYRNIYFTCRASGNNLEVTARRTTIIGLNSRHIHVQYNYWKRSKYDAKCNNVNSFSTWRIKVISSSTFFYISLAPQSPEKFPNGKSIYIDSR